jgi:uncharacterized membrane protein
MNNARMTVTIFIFRAAFYGVILSNLKNPPPTDPWMKRQIAKIRV